jgi:hypothetical protein
MTTMKTTRETLDRIRPYAVFRESWDTALNNALDLLDELKSDSDQESHINPFVSNEAFEDQTRGLKERTTIQIKQTEKSELDKLAHQLSDSHIEGRCDC